jgi:hypothetical protein
MNCTCLSASSGLVRYAMAALICSLLDGKKRRGRRCVVEGEGGGGAWVLLVISSDGRGNLLTPLPCFPRFRWIFAAKAWNRFEVEVSRPQTHGHFSKLLVCCVWGVKPIYHDGPVMELPYCLCFVEQHHIFDSYYHGGREGERKGGKK